MVKTVSSAEAETSIGQVLDAVSATKEPVMVEKRGEVVAVIISPEAFRRLEDDARDWATVLAVAERNDHHDPDQVFADVTAEVEAVRREMYAERQAH